MRREERDGGGDGGDGKEIIRVLGGGAGRGEGGGESEGVVADVSEGTETGKEEVTDTVTNRKTIESGPEEEEVESDEGKEMPMPVMKDRTEATVKRVKVLCRVTNHQVSRPIT